jgi:MFS family permease
MVICKSEEAEQSLAESQHLELGRNDDETNESLAGFAIQDVYFLDGGVNAWRTALGGFLAFTASIGFLSGGSVFQSYYITTTLPSSDPSDIAWIGSVQLWGCFFFGIWAGRLSDKYGPTLFVPWGGNHLFGPWQHDGFYLEEILSVPVIPGILHGIGNGIDIYTGSSNPIAMVL